MVGSLSKQRKLCQTSIALPRSRSVFRVPVSEYASVANQGSTRPVLCHVPTSRGRRTSIQVCKSTLPKPGLPRLVSIGNGNQTSKVWVVLQGGRRVVMLRGLDHAGAMRRLSPSSLQQRSLESMSSGLASDAPGHDAGPPTASFARSTLPMPRGTARR